MKRNGPLWPLVMLVFAALWMGGGQASAGVLWDDDNDWIFGEWLLPCASCATAARRENAGCAPAGVNGPPLAPSTERAVMVATAKQATGGAPEST